MNNHKSNYYQILGLKRDASAPEIEQAFLQIQDNMSSVAQDLESTDYALFQRAYEVLINPQRRNLYDSLLAETDELPLIFKSQTSSAQLQVLDVPQLVYLLVELRSPDMAGQKSLPLNLCLVIDRSTSMRGERLQQVKNALRMLLEKLSPADVLSIVSFSDRAEVVLPAQHVGEHREPVAQIQAIQASGGTEIFQGLKAGTQQISKMALREHNNQLILLTDGRTYGDAGQSLQLARHEAGIGITFNAFGIGADWDDQFLDALVAPSGGSAAYINSPQTIVSVLETRLQGLGDTFARHVSLKQNWPRRVRLLDAFRLTPYAKPLSIDKDEINLGDIEGRTPLTFLLEFSVEPHPIPTRIRIPLAITAEFSGNQNQSLAEQIQLTLLNDAQATEPPPELVRAVQLLTLYRLNEQAWQDIEAGQAGQAATRLHHLATRFLEVGEPRLAQQADREARRLMGSKNLSADGRKQLKYGTRTLMGKTLQLDFYD